MAMRKDRTASAKKPRCRFLIPMLLRAVIRREEGEKDMVVVVDKRRWKGGRDGEMNEKGTTTKIMRTCRQARSVGWMGGVMGACNSMNSILHNTERLRFADAPEDLRVHGLLSTVNMIFGANSKRRDNISPGNGNTNMFVKSK